MKLTVEENPSSTLWKASCTNAVSSIGPRIMKRSLSSLYDTEDYEVGDCTVDSWVAILFGGIRSVVTEGRL